MILAIAAIARAQGPNVSVVNPASRPVPVISATGGLSGAVTQVTGSSGNVANATATASLPAVAGKTNFLTGFQCTATGATGALVVNVTVTGLVTGTATYTFVFPAGVTVQATSLIVSFVTPVKASAVNTAIVVTLPAGGTGNTNAAVNVQGYNQ
jgi:hypothetical protein